MAAPSYFAWMVTFSKQKPPPTAFEDTDCDRGALKIQRAWRPPKRAAADGSLWVVDDTFDGRDDLYVDIYPAGTTSECARGWLRNNWKKLSTFEPVNVMLVRLAGPGTASEQPGPAEDSVAPEDRGFACKFTEKDWTGDFKQRGRGQPTPLLPKDWESTLDADTSGIDEPADCGAVSRARNACTPQQEEAIGWQALSWRQIVAPVLEKLGSFALPTPRIATLMALEQLRDNTDPPLFFLKRKYMRGRPGNCCAGVEPMFAPPHRLHPGHPAFPSGHATLAYTAAYFFIELFKAQAPGLDELARQALLDAAQGVAYNREAAGLHYPSDSEAGRALAQWLIEQAVKNEGFKALMAEARAEWPQFAATPPAA